MEKIIVNRKIFVKVKVTDEFKKSFTQEMQNGINKLEAELSFLEQRAKKVITELTIKGSSQVSAVREQLEFEKQKREEAKANFMEQIRVASTLENGKEVVRGELEGPVEVKIGDNWEEIIQREIVIEDGVVIEIR
ncbi:MAG: YlqD family protein [Clostridia bacterium]|nr:YlqD family protein [Clostridia bacterium]